MDEKTTFRIGERNIPIPMGYNAEEGKLNLKEPRLNIVPTEVQKIAPN